MATRDRKGVSLVKGPVAILGLASLVYGILGLILGGQSFSGLSIPDGTINGENFLGIEGNGWTNLLFIAAGALLLFGAPLHWGAKTMGILVGLALGAASVIALVDGEDVFGIFAANGLTKLVWGAGSVALLLLSLLPRVGKKQRDDTAGRDRDRDRRERTMEVHRERTEVHRERPVDAPRERTVETPREPAMEAPRERTRERNLDAPPRRFEREVVEREPVSSRSADDGSSGSRRVTGDDGLTADDARRAAPDAGPSGTRRVVAPADGDGPSDHGRNER